MRLASAPPCRVGQPPRRLGAAQTRTSSSPTDRTGEIAETARRPRSPLRSEREGGRGSLRRRVSSTRAAATSRAAIPTLRDIRVLDGALAVWAVLWLVAGVFVYLSVRQLEDYGETTVTASIGLRQTSDGLIRAADGLRSTGDALASLPFVGDEINANIRRTAGDIDTIAKTVRATAFQARVSGEQTRDTAHGVAIVLASAIVLVSTLPITALYLLLRPLIRQQLTRR